MATFIFEVVLQGEGDTMEEAWLDACNALADDSGEPDSYRELEED